MGQERILVVEDETNVAMALCRVLKLPEGGGYQVESCDSGESALDRLQEKHFDLLVTDLRMPGMSGLELLERARLVSPETRSILITAYGSSQVEQDAQRKANYYLPKPFTMKNFVRAVQQALSMAPVSPPQTVALSEEGLRAMQQRMEKLRIDVGAAGALLLDASGQLLAETGRRERFDVRTLLVLLGNVMTAANEVSRLLKDDNAFGLHYHEGKEYELYTARVSNQVILALILDRREGSGRIGTVWVSLRRAVGDLRDLLAKTTTSPAKAMEAKEELTTAAKQTREQARKPAEVASVEKNDQPPALDGNTLLTFEQARALGLISGDAFANQ